MNRSNISHRERLETCLSGEKPDRIPVALWRHFPVDDQSPYTLAAATALFQNTYDFDLIKVMPTSSFCLKDWGAEDQWNGNYHGTRDYTRQVVHQAQDWHNLKTLDPTQGKLGDQIICLELLTSEFSPHTPIIQTIFNPLSQAKNLAGGSRLLFHLRSNPEAVHAGLETITRTTIAFIEKAAKTGIDGIFLAVQHGQYSLLSEYEYETFGKPYDMRLLEAAGGMWLNLLHIHGEDIMFDLLAGYPAAIANWHDRETYPSLAEAGQLFNGVLCGGLRQEDTLVLGTPDKVIAEAREAIEITGGKKFILGTGCVTPITAPHGNILAARQVVDLL